MKNGKLVLQNAWTVLSTDTVLIISKLVKLRLLLLKALDGKPLILKVYG